MSHATALTYYGVDVGDVLAVRTSGAIPAIVRFSERMAGKANLDNHVVIVHHLDAAGVPWGIEGRPGGVGWADIRQYLDSHNTRHNAAQPKSDWQRKTIASNAAAMLGTPYDWRAIAGDAFSWMLPNLAKLYARNWRGHGSPGQVVCSSFAAFLYRYASLPRPSVDSERFCEPGDWTAFIESEAWQHAHPIPYNLTAKALRS